MMNTITKNLQLQKGLAAGSVLFCLVCVLTFTVPAFGEDFTLSLSSDQGATNSTVTLSLTLSYPSAAVAAGFNLDIYYDKEVLEVEVDGGGEPIVGAGQILVNADKEISVNEFTHPYFGVLRMIVVGFDGTIIEPGEAATIGFKIKVTAAAGLTDVELTNLIGTDAVGDILEDVVGNKGVIDVIVGDFDGDTIPDNVDNCPLIGNGPAGGTCILGTVGEPCLVDGECGPGGICSINQEDSYPPDGNNCGDACECEGNLDGDVDCDGEDAAVFKEDFGRNKYTDPCNEGPECNGNFNCDLDVDGEDAAVFKEDFGRNKYTDPCPGCTKEGWCD